MESLEQLLQTAWAKLGPGILADASELRRRLARPLSAHNRRPLRPWCLTVRASDSRITPVNTAVVPDDACYPGRPDLYRKHDLTLDAQLLARLSRRVYVDRETIQEVAAKVGRSPTSLIAARVRGVLGTQHIPWRGGRQPILSAGRLLDPSADRLMTLDPIFDCLSSRLLDHIPARLSQTVQRIPHYRSHVSRHRYSDNQHPELDGSSRRPTLRLPPPQPDSVWYKWSKSGHYLGDDPSNWRKSPEDPGDRPPRYLPKKHRTRKSRRRSPSPSGRVTIYLTK
jgi:hypothetical protein